MDAFLRHGLQARDIAVLSPFKAQARLLTVILEQAAAQGADDACGDVEAHTVDRFQGRDKACHLASSVLRLKASCSSSLRHVCSCPLSCAFSCDDDRLMSSVVMSYVRSL